MKTIKGELYNGEEYKLDISKKTTLLIEHKFEVFNLDITNIEIAGNLEHFQFLKKPIKEIKLENLNKCSKLKTVNISLSKVGDFRTLAQNETIEKMHIEFHCKVENPLLGLPKNLKTLLIRLYDPSSTIDLVNLPKSITNLSISGNHIGPKKRTDYRGPIDLSPLSQFKIEKLKLNSFRWDELVLPKLKYLTHFYLYFTSFNNFSTNIIGQSKKLENFFIGTSYWNTFNIDGLTQLPSLKAFEIDNTHKLEYSLDEKYRSGEKTILSPALKKYMPKKEGEIIGLQTQVLEALYPPAKICSKNIISYQLFEGDKFIYYIKFFPNNIACKINIKGEHNKDLVISFLNEITAENLLLLNEKKPFSLSNSKVLSKTDFCKKAIIHPSLTNNSLGKTTKFMRNITYSLFPVYNCEFTHKDSVDEFSYRFNRVISFSDWNREPAPVVSARFHFKKSNIRGGAKNGERLGIFKPNEIKSDLSELIKDEGFIDVENYERKEVHIEIENGVCEITSGNEKWIQNTETLSVWFNLFILEGLDKSMERIQTIKASANDNSKEKKEDLLFLQAQIKNYYGASDDFDNHYIYYEVDEYDLDEKKYKDEEVIKMPIVSIYKNTTVCEFTRVNDSSLPLNLIIELIRTTFLQELVDGYYNSDNLELVDLDNKTWTRILFKASTDKMQWIKATDKMPHDIDKRKTKLVI